MKRSLHGSVALLLGLFASVPPGARAQGVSAKSGAATAPGGDGADAGRETLEASKLSKVPKQKTFVKADYPPEAKAQGLEGEVTLLLDINAEGTIDAVSVVEATPPGVGFEEAASIAAQGFEFEPAEVEGKPIAVQLSYRYRFTLEPEEPASAPPPGPESPGQNDAPAAAPKPAKAPVANFTGLLLERGTRSPLPGVIVTVFRDDGDAPVGYEATTSEQGRFEFFDLPAGPWKVLIEAPGFYPFRTTEELAENEAIDATYYEERQSYNPYDVTVTADRPRKEVSRTVISAKEIDKIPGTAGDPLAVIQNFAGVARTPVGSGQIIVRGSAPEDTRVFVDGVEVPIIYHFGGLRSVLPIGMLDGIDFYPGNFAPSYGRATGGVIDVRTKKPEAKQLRGYADVSLLDTGVFLEIPLGTKGSLSLSGRRSYIDFILNAVVPEDADVNLVAAPRYYDYQLLATYRPAPAHDIRFFFFGSDDRLELLFTNPADLDTAVTGNSLSASTTFYRSATTYRYVPSPNFSNTLRISQGRNWFNFSVGNLVFDLNVYVSQIRDTVEQRINDRLSLRYGVDFLFSRANGLIRLPLPPKEGEPVGNFDLSETRTADFTNNDFYEPALFAEAELRLTDKLLALPGVRADYFSQVKEAVVQPRVTVRYSLTDTVTLKGGVGLFAQPPQPDETSKDFGNPNLKGEKAAHYSAGAEYRPLRHLTFDLTGFYKDLWDQVSGTDAFRIGASGERIPLVYDNGGTGRVYGLEAVIRHEFSNNFTGWLAYTLSRAERTDSGSGASRRFDFDQPHILTMIASYILPRNWQIGSRFRLVSGNPLTPIQGATFNAVTDRYDPIFGPVNSGRNGAFHQLDLRVDKRWVYDRWMLNVYLDVQNLYNRSNPEGQQYNYDYRRSRPQQGLPILTILGIRAEF